MLFAITGKHIEITDAIKSYAKKKASGLPRFYSSLNKVEVILDGEQGGNSISVEIIAMAGHNKIFIVTERGKDAYKSIGLAVRKLERQLRRAKTKERDNKHTGS